MTRNKIALVISLILLCLGACAPKRNSYSGFEQIAAEKGWPYTQPLIFNVEHPDSIVSGVLSLTLRHTDDYPYSNIWLEVKYNDSYNTTYTDTLNITLADIYGNWSGQGSGVWKQVETTISPSLSHRNGDNVTVRHIMRVDTLKAVDLIGICFTENE